MDTHSDRLVSDLAAAVAIRSVSSDPSLRPEVVRMIHWVGDRAKSLGGSVQIHPNPLGSQVAEDGSTLPLPPLLTASFKSPNPAAKTVLVYGHLDVQPAPLHGPADGWNSDPFVLTNVGGKLYGRGSTDDKAPVLGWFAVIEAYAAIGKPLPVNLEFILEGMEESGSEGLDEFIFQQRDAGAFKHVSAVCISDN